MNITSTITGLDGFRSADASAIMQRLGAAAAQARAERVAAKAQELAPRDTGALADSVQAEDGMVSAGASYAAEVHGPIDGSGRGGRSEPRYVSIDQLMGWSLRHGLSPWSVQWAIAQNGTPYQPFMADALDAVRAAFPQLNQTALAELKAALLAGG